MISSDTPKLRKSLYNPFNLPKKYIKQLTDDVNTPFMVTEKTDGFVFAVGVHDDQLYCQSATSPRMSKFGAFSEWQKDKLANDPLVTMRLDLALELMKMIPDVHGIFRKFDIPFIGEMILKVDGEFFRPNSNRIVPYVHGHPFKKYGAFVLHTMNKNNWGFPYDFLQNFPHFLNNNLLGFANDTFMNAKRYMLSNKGEDWNDRTAFRYRIIETILGTEEREWLKSKLTGSTDVEDYVIHFPNVSMKLQLTSEEQAKWK